MYDAEIPMDLRGIANVADSIQYIAGGMLANQQVSDKVFKLEWQKIVIPAVNYTAEELGISLYPMPATDMISIDYQGDEQLLSYTIVDMVGRKVQEGNLSTKGIDVSTLSDANYQLLITTESGKSVTTSIVIVK